MTPALTDAPSDWVPRYLPGLGYKTLIDGNCVCTNDLNEMADFIGRRIRVFDFARRCSVRSREITRESFSVARLRSRYGVNMERDRAAFERSPIPPSISDWASSLLKRFR